MIKIKIPENLAENPPPPHQEGKFSEIGSIHFRQFWVTLGLAGRKAPPRVATQRNVFIWGVWGQSSFPYSCLLSVWKVNDPLSKKQSQHKYRFANLCMWMFLFSGVPVAMLIVFSNVFSTIFAWSVICTTKCIQTPILFTVQSIGPICSLSSFAIQSKQK